MKSKIKEIDRLFWQLLVKTSRFLINLINLIKKLSKDVREFDYKAYIKSLPVRVRGIIERHGFVFLTVGILGFATYLGIYWFVNNPLFLVIYLDGIIWGVLIAVHFWSKERKESTEFRRQLIRHIDHLTGKCTMLEFELDNLKTRDKSKL